MSPNIIDHLLLQSPIREISRPVRAEAGSTRSSLAYGCRWCYRAGRISILDWLDQLPQR